MLALRPTAKLAVLALVNATPLPLTALAPALLLSLAPTVDATSPTIAALVWAKAAATLLVARLPTSALAIPVLEA